ncbi:50S ribosomal protein L24 [Geobacter sulfurreducens]|jgi:large subunit ribosomal protein L24|uniref:Large ribosomal subunit protein uL24 n=1 Tax=Geobacter sulfurreducens (strain ATCC 51573 / DSM 12127 / PCA) TaxID=243231 RepID=RL24_GEOSL|nr:50S ribosomal protein L24 [Geobacter sulfurreducens]P60740.1 RecName: Full=Large ribosomal subunit protein uL24; AltName: Full=50S ribosomal protein L24 [Geobacter sulfurreducens PCA]AAR36239.1 ribosomal protein L24 [Geobacter sulfurreducens PCA]ADI85600.1 ribosomal protein L24 [Geobacter sulfurreducens KN400]AJY69114.1 50S ribosomal protein L24 [Geobacter sulfurreducens]QVW34662.1 50S ribosomal protein L24 [Geobacter sulfurreducens]UAC03531.1 50S ribosomal protein L24 [Geobacter sulfurred
MLDKKFHIKKGDTVSVVTGKDKSKTGTVLRILPKRDGVLVEGLNIVKRHTRARGNEPGGIVEKEAPLHVSNVMLYCGKCEKPVRAKKAILEDGKKVRVCVKCGEAFDK